MKKFIAILAILALLAMPAWAGPKISRNGGGQPSDANLTAVAGLTPTANAVIGWTTGPTMAALTTHSHSASAAQFYDASATTKLVKIDPAGNTAGATTTLAFSNSTSKTITFPDYTGGVPVIILQEYDTTTLSETDEADIAGCTITVPDGFFTSGRAFKFVAGGTVTGANGTISVILDVEGADAMKLTTADGAAGDWMAEFTIVATGAATQKIIGKLVAEGGVETKVDYATGSVNTATAGTIPMKLQLDLGHADDSITSEYCQIWHWSIADAD